MGIGDVEVGSVCRFVNFRLGRLGLRGCDFCVECLDTNGVKCAGLGAEGVQLDLPVRRSSATGPLGQAPRLRDGD